jgi:uncharacterized protein DUF6636
MNRRLVATLALSLVVVAAGASPAAAKLRFFQSPSHNIGCVMSGKFVRCDIKNHSWPTPPKPPSCDVDYGQGVAVGKRDVRASFVCAGDTAFDPNADVLAYGDRISQRRMRCASKSKGMRCVNRDTKHGFFLSSQDVRLF